MAKKHRKHNPATATTLPEVTVHTPLVEAVVEEAKVIVEAGAVIEDRTEEPEPES